MYHFDEEQMAAAAKCLPHFAGVRKLEIDKCEGLTAERAEELAPLFARQEELELYTGTPAAFAAGALRHCGALRQLRVSGIEDLTAEQAEELAPLFARLEVLQFQNGIPAAFAAGALRHCGSLRQFVLLCWEGWACPADVGHVEAIVELLQPGQPLHQLPRLYLGPLPVEKLAFAEALAPGLAAWQKELRVEKRTDPAVKKIYEASAQVTCCVPAKMSDKYAKFEDYAGDAGFRLDRGAS